MKFMSSLQCLMGGNGVQFQHSSSSGLVSTAVSASSSTYDKTENVSSGNKKKSKKKKKDDRKVIKVFKHPHGEINLYHKSVKASEVMIDEYMVCRSDSFYIGHKIPALSHHDRLEPGNTYFLLPAHLFHSVLSFVTIASFTNSKQSQIEDTSPDANMKMKATFLKKAAASSCSPFDIQKTPSGTLRIRVSELFISQLMVDQVAAAANHDQMMVDNLLCTTPQLHKEYEQLVVGSRRGWKPKLEMIKETAGKRKVKMILSASFNRVKKKMKKNNNPSQIPSSSLRKARKTKKIKIKKPTVANSLKANRFSNTPVGI